MKLVDPSREARSIALRVAGLANAREVRVTTLGADPEVENTLEEPTAVAPRSSTTTITGGVVEYALGAHTLAVLRVR